MTTSQGTHCPFCGTWIAGETLACICGFRHRRETWAALGSALVAAVSMGFLVGLYWVPGFFLCIWPLGVLGLTAAIYGVRCGLLAVRGRAFDRALGGLSLLLCIASLALPAVLIVAARLRR